MQVAEDQPIVLNIAEAQTAYEALRHLAAVGRKLGELTMADVRQLHKVYDRIGEQLPHELLMPFNRGF